MSRNPDARRIIRHRLCLALCAFGVYAFGSSTIHAQETKAASDPQPQPEDPSGVFINEEELSQKELQAIETNAQTNEDPDAQRRVDRER